MGRILPVFLAMGIAACGGSAAVVSEPGTDADRNGTVQLANTETFDVSRWRDEPVAVVQEVRHDVPQALMENRADAGVEQTVAGYRVQVMATLDPVEAQNTEAALRRWWGAEASRMSQDGPVEREQRVYRLFRQPYYRIRIGDLTRRADAEALQAVVSRRFGGAFIVPDQVTVIKPGG